MREEWGDTIPRTAGGGQWTEPGGGTAVATRPFGASPAPLRRRRAVGEDREAAQVQVHGVAHRGAGASCDGPCAIRPRHQRGGRMGREGRGERTCARPPHVPLRCLGSLVSICAPSRGPCDLRVEGRSPSIVSAVGRASVPAGTEASATDARPSRGRPGHGARFTREGARPGRLSSASRPREVSAVSVITSTRPSVRTRYDEAGSVRMG